MSVRRLSLTNFRSYETALLKPSASFAVLTGENGAGKTNVLEALSLLAPGRGLRGAKLVDVARDNGEGGFVVAAQIAADGGPVDLGTGTTPQAPDRRQVRINGAAASAAALGEWLSILWLTPAMDRLFADTPGARRRFLDRLVLTLSPSHARHVSRYESAMRDRNRLLSDEAPLDLEWCAALETQMAEHGVAVTEARNDALAALNAIMRDAPDGPFARAGLALKGWALTGNLLQELTAGRSRDRAAGRSLSGPHRSDLAVTHLANGRPADSCSTGEQKALLLSIILAHADIVTTRIGRRPILLLDEVAAHLDPSRRAALFERLAVSGGQVWMTGTEDALFAEINSETSHFHVANGAVFAA